MIEKVAQDVEKLVRPDIRDMEPYTPILPFEVLSEQLGRSPDQIIKLIRACEQSRPWHNAPLTSNQRPSMARTRRSMAPDAMSCAASRVSACTVISPRLRSIETVPGVSVIELA